MKHNIQNQLDAGKAQSEIYLFKYFIIYQKKEKGVKSMIQATTLRSQKEEINPQIGRKVEIIKMRVEINEIDK